MRLRNILCLIFILVAAFSVSSSYAQTIDLDVNGIRIQASYDSIIKKLGKPISDKRKGEVPCGESMRTLNYDGLILMLEVGGLEPLGLYKVEVTSRRWLVSGSRIGDSKKKVIKTIGQGKELEENGDHYLSYFIEDGWARFHFDGNRLKKVAWEFNFC